MKPHIKSLGCFKQVASVIGEAKAQIELFKVVNCKRQVVLELDPKATDIVEAFSWDEAPQGYSFWSIIDDEIAS